MLVNHIGGWKCTLGHTRNTLPGGSGIQSRLQLSTFEYFTRKPTLELDHFELNSIFEYFYFSPIQNSSIWILILYYHDIWQKKTTLELRPLHEITALALFAILSFKSFQLSISWHFFIFYWGFFMWFIMTTKNLCERQRILWTRWKYFFGVITVTAILRHLWSLQQSCYLSGGINPVIKFIVPLKMGIILPH